MGRCGGLERTDLGYLPVWENVFISLKITYCGYLLHWEGVLVFKGLIFVTFHFGRVDRPERTNFA